MDNGAEEKVATLLYRLDVYSNKVAGKKSEVKAILAAIHPELYLRNFTRFSRAQINDLGDKILHVEEQHRVKFDGEGFYRI